MTSWSPDVVAEWMSTTEFAEYPSHFHYLLLYSFQVFILNVFFFDKQRYAGTFKAEKIRGSLLVTITDSMLKDLGITAMGDRIEFLRVVSELKK